MADGELAAQRSAAPAVVPGPDAVTPVRRGPVQHVPGVPVRRGPVTLRSRDLERLRAALQEHPGLAEAIRGGDA